MADMRTSTGLAVTVVGLTSSLIMAQSPKPTTPLPVEIQSVDQLPKDAVVLWIDGQDLTLYVDSTSNPEDRNRIAALEIKWKGPGPGFQLEDMDCGAFPCCPLPCWVGDCDCRPDQLIGVTPRGFGPEYSAGRVIPDGYLETWSPGISWIVDGSYLTGGMLDKFDPDSPYFGPVPEPSSVATGMLGIGGFLLLRKRE